MSNLARPAATLLASLALLAAHAQAGPIDPPRPARPDPASVRRAGPGYRYPQDGWTVLHVEGEPYDRGVQHGTLMANELADIVRSLATYRSVKSPTDGWREVRLLTDALFLRKYDPEYLEEMKGIADGAAAAGSTFEGRKLDLLDIAAINSEVEIGCLENGLDALPTGLEGRRFPVRPKGEQEGHCSAFVANGTATADGKPILGHITMFNLYHARLYNVWLDVKPSKGHRVLMQTYAGGIQSGMDYYLNDNGLILCETTIGQTRFDAEGTPLASRIRQVMQYADTIDDACRLLKERNNGLYSNEWLMADGNTGEIAMFELGTRKTKLWRSGKDEWYAGTKGFYWGCNNEKDLDVRLETESSVAARPANVVWHPSVRDVKWLQLFDKYNGKIGPEFGFEAFTTPPLAAFSSLDAKFATASMAKELKTFALWGPPLGKTWDPTDADRKRLPDIRPIAPQDWTVLTAEPPAPLPSAAKPVVDLLAKAVGRDEVKLDPERPTLWRGTILPTADADTWLAAAFADYEPIAAIQEKGAGKAQVDLALFGAKARHYAATRRHGRDVPLAETKASPRAGEWYDIAAGKGVLLLADLRDIMGGPRFDAFMDEFGLAHANRPASTADFIAAAQRAHGEPRNDHGKSLIAFRQGWIAEARPSAEAWSLDAFEAEPERALIVYGTTHDADAQREGAALLQRKVTRRFYNYSIPIKADVDVTDADLKGRHLLLVGRPATNRVAARLADRLPLAFGPSSFRVGESTYGHESSAIVAAGAHPGDPRYSLVVFAGNSAEATRRAANALPDRGGPVAPALLLEAGNPPTPILLPTRPAGPLTADAGLTR